MLRVSLSVVCLLLPPSGAAVDYLLEEQLHRRLEQAAEGDVEAQYAVGDMYYKGRGTHVDWDKAHTWFSRSAAQGHRKAEFKLGYMYLKGIGVQQNSTRAFELMSSSAAQRYAPAQFYLGQMYALGMGVEKNSTLALRWLRASTEEGYRPPKAELARIRADLDRVLNGHELEPAGRP